MSVGIYGIQNKINKKWYIGQSVNIKKRINAHFSAAINSNSKDYNTPFHRSIRKYGKSAFICKTLELCSSEELNEREIYWINRFNSFKNGYNLTSGGDAPEERTPKINLEGIINDIKTSELYFAEIAEKFNVSYETVQAINTGRAWFNQDEEYPLRKFNLVKPRENWKCNSKMNIDYKKAFYEKEFCVECGSLLSRGNDSKLCIKCFNKNKAKEIYENLSVSKEEYVSDVLALTSNELASKYGITEQHANRIKRSYDVSFHQTEYSEELKSLLKKGCSFKEITRIIGYTSERIKNIMLRNGYTKEQIEEYIKISRKEKVVSMFSLDGKLLKTFSSLGEAYRFLNVTHGSQIQKAILRGTGIYKGYIWKYS